MGNVTILALDPGGTTGWASLTMTAIEGPDGTEYYDRDFKCGHLGPDPHHQRLEYLIESNITDTFHLVCESFEYRNKSRAGLVLDSVEYIGVAKLVAQKRNLRGFYMQTASMGKGFVSDDNLKKLGLWQGTKWKHAMDAYRHLLYWVINTSRYTDLKRSLLEMGWK